MQKFSNNKTEYEKYNGIVPILKIGLTKLFGLFVQIAFGNNLRVRFGKAMGISIGKNVFIGKYCKLDDTFPELIVIEENANISFGVTVVAHDASKNIVAKVTIKESAYLGTGSIILPGVVIGARAVVGAGSVVTKDVLPGCIVAGVPAVQIGNV